MQVTISLDGTKIDLVHVGDVDAYVDLLREYGYAGPDGETWVFKSAVVIGPTLHVLMVFPKHI